MEIGNLVLTGRTRLYGKVPARLKRLLKAPVLNPLKMTPTWLVACSYRPAATTLVLALAKQVPLPLIRIPQFTPPSLPLATVLTLSVVAVTSRQAPTQRLPPPRSRNRWTTYEKRDKNQSALLLTAPPPKKKSSTRKPSQVTPRYVTGVRFSTVEATTHSYPRSPFLPTLPERAFSLKPGPSV